MFILLSFWACFWNRITSLKSPAWNVDQWFTAYWMCCMLQYLQNTSWDAPRELGWCSRRRQEITYWSCCRDHVFWSKAHQHKPKLLSPPTLLTSWLVLSLDLAAFSTRNESLALINWGETPWSTAETVSQLVEHVYRSPDCYYFVCSHNMLVSLLGSGMKWRRVVHLHSL